MSAMHPAALKEPLDPNDADRLELLRDADFFTIELIRRLEALAAIEKHGRTFGMWQQASLLTKKIQGLLRHQADEQRRYARRRAERERRKAEDGS